MTFQPWKLETPEVYDSMYALLQWGHDFSAMEIWEQILG